MSPDDYTDGRGVLTFAPGATEATISIPIADDAVPEEVESFAVTLGPGEGYRANPSSNVAFAKILDNDGDELVPSRATVNGTTLLLTYNEILDSASTPSPSHFYVTADDNRVEVDQVSVVGSMVTLTLATAVEAGQTVTLDYVSGVGQNQIQDGEGNAAMSFTDWLVTNIIFTTLPVMPVARAGGGGQETVLYFAHFANGSGTTSDLVFVNVFPRPSGPGPTPYHATISPSRPALYFYDQEGNLMDPASVVDLTGDLEVTGDGALSIQTEMEPLGELTISTHGRGEVVSGSVQVAADGPIGRVLRFDLPGIGVAGVGASQPVRDALFPARRQAGGISTAAAIHNPGEEAMGVNCQLMKDGAVLEEVEIPLEANGQESRFIEEVFAGTDTADFVGSGRCTATGEGMFTGVAVELDASNRIFTTLPMVPVQR